MSILKTLNTFLQRKISTRVNNRIDRLEEILNSLALDYVELDDSSAMNGQAKRRLVLEDIFSKVEFDVCVEAGTYLGVTTAYLARFFDKVYSIEINDLYFNVSKNNLRALGNIESIHANSVDGLVGLQEKLKGKTLFCYLDAHWGKYLPLHRELEILTEFERAVILIDDFQVRADSAYSYDNYGPGKALDYETFSSTFKGLGYQVYEPSIPASDETGHRRGWVLCSRNKALSQILSEINGISHVI